MNESVSVTWLGHSCFSLTWKGYTVITDPYADGSVPGLPPLRVEGDAVYCSHGHFDHNFTAAVTLTGHPAPEGFSVEEYSCPHDDQGGAKRGPNTIRLFRFGGLSVVHMGDAGCRPAPEVMAALRGCSLLLIPAGGFFTIDGDTARNLSYELAPQCTVPMHYRGEDFGFDVISTVDDFVGGREDVLFCGCSGLTLRVDAPRGTLVLEPRR